MKLRFYSAVLAIFMTCIAPVVNADESCTMRPLQEIEKTLEVQGFAFKMQLPVMDSMSGARYEHKDGSFVVLIIQGDQGCEAFRFIQNEKA